MELPTRISFPGFLVVALMLVGSASAAQKIDFNRDIRPILASKCFTCHGPDAEGIEGLGKDLNNNEFVQSLTDPELIAFLEVGRPASDPANEAGVDMPPKGGNPALSDQDLQDIVAFLRTLQ